MLSGINLLKLNNPRSKKNNNTNYIPKARALAIKCMVLLAFTGLKHRTKKPKTRNTKQNH